MTTTTVATYTQAIDLQERLVRRGILPRVEHDVADARHCADGVTTLVECTCGRGLFRPDDESEPAYVKHVIEALRREVLAVAA